MVDETAHIATSGSGVSSSKMDRSRVLKHLLIAITVAVITAVGCLANDPALDKSSDGPSSCPQEMCVFLFDRLEEQSVRLRNIEDALLRAVSILASSGDQEFSAASAALKSDSLLNSLFSADTYDPVDSIVLFPYQVSDSLESPVKGRKKRQIEKQFMSPKERLTEALKWTKKISFDTVPVPTAGTVQLVAGFKTPAPIVELEPIVDLEDVHSAVVEDRIAAPTSAMEKEVGISSGSSQPEIASRALRPTTPRTTTTTTTMRTTTLRATSRRVSTTAAMYTSRAPVRTTSTTSLPLVNTNTTFLRSNPATSLLTDMDQPATKRFVSNAVDDLQSAMKCALTQLGDDDTSDPTGILLNPQAILNGNGTLTIQFEMKSCQKYWQAVWIRIFVRNEFVIPRKTKNSRLKDENYLTLRIPKQCLNDIGNIVSFTLPSTSKGSCSFPLADLVECKIYTVEIIPIYLTLHGQPSTMDFTVPPRLAGNSTDLVSLERVFTHNSTHMLALKWSARSDDCAQLMTSVKLRIYEDESDNMLHSFIVPTHCIGNPYQNSFSAKFSFFDDETDFCKSITWKPLDTCRKYKFEAEPEYASLWKGNSSSVEIFTSGADPSHCCYMQTSSSGILRSDNHDGNQGSCTWLIVVEEGSTIWLTFTDYAIEDHYRMKVYDGTSSTSPLLIEHSGNQPPQPIRSKSNKLFFQLVPTIGYFRLHENGYGKHFVARYISVRDTRTPYVAGCGGYIKSTGEIVKPAYPYPYPSDNSTAECLWYIESTESADSTLITSASGRIVSFPIIVYDGWSEDGILLYNGSSKACIYSHGRKMLVKFPAWNSLEREREYSWNIHSMYPVKSCSYNLTGPSDTFSSHDDNTNSYSPFLDCQWTIHVDDSSNIRLTFVYFNIKNDHDFVSVYDGPTLNSLLLVELSGKKSKPVSFTSESNQLLVRFTTNVKSDDPVSYKGFLAFYTTVPRGVKAEQTMDMTKNLLLESSIALKSVNLNGPRTLSTTEG